MLVVDDDLTNRIVMEELLDDEFSVALAESGEDCLELTRSFVPAVILLDVMMPGLDGYETCRELRAIERSEALQIIFVSARVSTEDRLRGYSEGGDDYVPKPFDHDELLAKLRVHVRLQNALTALSRAKHAIEEHNAQLEDIVLERTEEVIATRDIVVFGLAKLADSRDPETGEHLERMREYSQCLAQQLSREGPYRDQIGAQFLTTLYVSSPLHDIGKVGIPDAVLRKPERLTREEFEVMKTHTTIGADAIDQAIARSDHGGFLEMAAVVARYHHERFDGSGYPAGLKGQDIPLAARIVAVADVFDALTSRRVYKEALPPEAAWQTIASESGRHFDPVVVDAFKVCYPTLVEVCKASQRAEQIEEKTTEGVAELA